MLHRIANGHYVVVPHEHVGTPWRPSLEAVGASIAISDVGIEHTVVTGVSAARLHHAIPRRSGSRWSPFPGSEPGCACAIATRDAARALLPRPGGETVPRDRCRLSPGVAW